MDVDGMLKQLGQFGRFQVFYFTLLLFPVMLCGYRGTEYIFTTMNIPHRCRVPECEGLAGHTEYSPSWLRHAVPFTNKNVPDVCLRYQPHHNYSPQSNSSCPVELFSNSTVFCDNWVFSEPAKTIAHDFDIMCPDDYWKLTLLSSLSVITSFIGLPLAGFLSDRVGRKTVLVYGSIIICITGIVRSFSFSYAMLATMEVFDGFITGTIYGPAFILGLEMLSPSKRLLGSLLINVYFTAGEVVLACVAWVLQDWRLQQRLFYMPMLCIVVLHWLLPESVRWLYTEGRYEEIKSIFQRIAKVNKTEDQLAGIFSALQAFPDKDEDKSPVGKVEDTIRATRITAVLRSRTIMRRLFILALCWIASIMTYYGVSQDVVSIGGNRYLSFLLISLVEVPAFVVSLWLPDWQLLGRRGSTAWSFFLGGAACLLSTLVTADQLVLNLALFLISKFCFTFTITVIYVYTAEIFPTELRQSLLSLCSMVGRLGSIFAQQTPLIERYVDPMLVMGVVAMVGGALALSCPETLGTRLPDTITEAEQIGTPQKPTEK